MKTSNFSTAGHDPHAVCISRGTPKGWRGRRYLALAPTWAMLKLPDPAYRTEYAAILSRLDPAQVYADLGPDAILLCWEQPGESCHRRLVAEWLEASLGITVPELEPQHRKEEGPMPGLFDDDG